MIEQAKQLAQRLREGTPDWQPINDSAADTIDALVADIERWKRNENLQMQRAIKAEAELERLSNHIHTCGPTCNKAGCMNKRLLEEVESLRKDAARYRWLRNECEEHHIGVYDYASDDKRRFWLAESQLDKEIDAAMQGAKE